MNKRKRENITVIMSTDRYDSTKAADKKAIGRVIPTEELYKYIGQQMKFWRKSKGLSQENLADAINVKRSTLASWEAGKNPVSIADLLDISNYLGINLDYFVGRIPPEKTTYTIEHMPFAMNFATVLSARNSINAILNRVNTQSSVSDAKSTVLAAVLQLLDQPSALDDLYSKQEIERFILERYGFEVDIESVSSLEHFDSQMIAQARKEKANALMSAVEHSIFNNTIFPEEIQEGIQKRLDDLADYLRKSGYAQGSMEAKADFADHAQEYDPDADFEIPDGEMYQDGFDDGVKDATPDDHDWDDQ